jgi:RecJ-like exonuclease
MSDAMTVAEARAVIVDKPLRFGDDEQIKAHNLLIYAKEFEGSDIPCSECDGEGTHTCDCGHVHDCEECGGSGQRSKTDLEGMTLPEILRSLAATTAGTL